MDDPGPSSAYYEAFASTEAGPVRRPSPPSSPLLGPESDSSPSVDNDSLYAILNLDRNASEAEIRDRYRSLATTFHPDRQRDEVSRRAAHGRFQDIQHAYEVLTDSRQRTIYDMFGEAGLQTNWELGPRNMTPEELRRQFQKEATEKLEMDTNALVKAKGDMTLFLDARAVFLPRSAWRRPEKLQHDPISRIQRIAPGQITLKNSFETPINKQTQLVWEGQMITRSGKGGANVMGTVRHQFSPKLWVEAGSSFLAPRVVSAKGTYVVNEHTFVTMNAVAQTILAPPRVVVRVGRQLYAETTGFITYSTGFFSLFSWGKSLSPSIAASSQSSLSVGLTTSRRNGSGWTVETSAGLLDSGVSADWSTRLLGITLKLGGSFSGSDGIKAFVSGDGKVTSLVRAGITVSVELSGNIIMRLRFSRLGQRFALPILLSPDASPRILVFATLLPTISYIALHHFYLVPKKRSKIHERIKELREENAEFIAQKKNDAQQAIGLMERSVQVKAEAEKLKNGLIIVSAHYGPASLFTPRGLREPIQGEEGVIDVTIPVQALVTDSHLSIPGGRGKYNLIGFWDPCIGENKKLRVRYLFRNKLHQVTVDDIAPLRLPLKTHILEG
ncbi:hypothetical protein BCR39DRAFT_509235 [Naematelia encephala]|uniref:J domain-containing protein n=1 Tax=Naematelia encephala TaxID=71784 RepID=A0A1Y2BKT5_9TREE|nr:hypothetical protein BCR39DRAFT_509235 [Naematelia encephala]